MWTKIISFFMSIYLFFAGLLGLDIPTPIDEGEIAVVSLVENPSTGYTWTYKITDDSVVEMTEKTVLEAPPEGMCGAPSTVGYCFKGLKKGSTVVVFTYSRSWEAEYPAKVQTYLFTVNEDLTVSYSEVK